MAINQLSKKDIRKYLDILLKYGFSDVPSKIKRGYEVILKGGSLIYLESQAVLVKRNNYIIPFIGIAEKCNLKKVLVDRGAVKPITNGADIMAPGIVRYENFKNGDVVSVLLEDVGTIIAIGVALINSEKLKEMKKGKVIKNLHYLSDVFWSNAKTRKV